MGPLRPDPRSYPGPAPHPDAQRPVGARSALIECAHSHRHIHPTLDGLLPHADK